MYTLVLVLILIICAILVLVVLVQNSKGGGFVSGMGATNQIMGARKSADFLEKLTWGLAFGLVGLTLIGSLLMPTKGGSSSSGSELEEKIENYTPAGAQPNQATPPPAQTAPPPAQDAPPAPGN